MGGRAFIHDEIDSTSSELSRLLDDGAPAGTVVVAGRQTRGRGRRGRSWHSPEGGNLYLSVAVDLGESGVSGLAALPLAAGVAAWEAVAPLLGDRPALKWPNDLLAGGRKLAGILCELPEPSRRPSLAIVGLGVNVVLQEFPGELADTATSLALESAALEGDIAPSLTARFVEGLEALVARIRDGAGAEIVEEWKERAEPFGRRVRVDDIVGTTVDLAADGRLIIERDDGERILVTAGVVESI